MPQIRAEQFFGLSLDNPTGTDHRLTNAHIANGAGIKQSKIEDWGDSPEGWISKGIIKPVTTAELPQWDGSQAGQFYYDTNTNEIFIGITTPPYYTLVAGDGGTGTGDASMKDRIIVVKSGPEAENWTGATDEDMNGTSSIYSLDTDKVASDGSNLLVYLNGVLQERGSGSDYSLYEEGEVDKIQFTYNLEGPDQKVTAIISIDEYLVNYATKAYVDDFVLNSTFHTHDGSASPRLDFNEAITPTSLSTIINSIIPAEGTDVDLGSATSQFANIYAKEGHFDANTIYIGGVAISSAGNILSVSKDGGSTFNEVALSGSLVQPAKLTSGTGQPIVLESDTGITAKGDILPDMTSAVGDVSTRNIGSPTQKFNSVYADEVFIGASSLYVNGKKVIEDNSDEMTFGTDLDQAMAIKTSSSTPGSGNGNLTLVAGNELNAQATGGMEYTVGSGASAKHMNFNNASGNGNITLMSTGSNSQVQLNAADEIDLTAPIIDVNGNLDVSGYTHTNTLLINNPPTITLSGDASGSVDFDGGDITLAVTVANDSHTHNELYLTGTESDAKYVDITGDTMTGSLIITGDLTVSGTTTTVNSEAVTIADNILLLNSNETGTPTQDAGIEIERGTSTNYQFLFDESTDDFKIGEIGSLQAVATREDSPLDNALAVWNDTTERFETDSSLVYNSDTNRLYSTTFEGALIGNATTASKLAATKNISLSGDVTGSVNFDGSADVAIATTVNSAAKLTTPRTIALTGDVTGSVDFDGSGNVSMTTVTGNDNHEHDGRYYTETESDTRFVNTAGDTMTGDLTISKNNPWITLDSSSVGGNSVEQAAGITVGGTGVAAIHMTYTADGSGHIGMGTVNTTTGVPTYEAMSLHYENNNVTFPGTIIATGGITGNIAGNASTATRLATARTIELTGDVTGSTTFDGSGNATITTDIGTITGKLTLKNGLTITTDSQSYQAGSLGYSDSSWGFVNRPPRAGTSGAHLFSTFADQHILTLKEDLTSTFGGNVTVGGQIIIDQTSSSVQDGLRITNGSQGFYFWVDENSLRKIDSDATGASAMSLNGTGGGEVLINTEVNDGENSLQVGGSAKITGQTVIENTTNGTVGLKVIQNLNDPNNTPSLIVTSDGESDDVIMELRANASGTIVDTSDTPNSDDAVFIVDGVGNVEAKGDISENGTILSNKYLGIASNALTATKLSATRSNWWVSGVAENVVGQLGWKNYGKNHTIFDASKATTPDGVVKSNTDPDVGWVPSYPTLMGYNGTSTYGVRVDISKKAESVKAGNFEIVHNTTDDSLDFNYIG